MRRGLNPADFDKRVQILVRSRVRDPSSGELVETFVALGKPLWASMLEGRALERYTAQQKVAEVSHGWRFRFAPGLLTLTPDQHRLRYNDQEFEIHGCLEIQRRQGVVVLSMARAEGLTAVGVPSAHPGT